MTNATSAFADNKIIKVTPGRLSRYVNERLTGNYMGNVSTDRPSALYDNANNTIPAKFKVYIYQLKLSKLCLNYIRQQLKGDVLVTLRWRMFEFEDFITCPERLELNKAKFDFTIKHNLEVNQDFVDRVADNPISFNLYAMCEGDEIFISEAQFFMADIVEVANIKQDQRVYFTSNIIDPSGEPIAYLDTWYKFTCKQKSLKTLFPTSRFEEQKKKKMTKMSDLLGEKFSARSQNFCTVYVTDSEFDQFADSVLLVLNRNKVLKTTQSDINSELQERVKWLRFEANWKQTLQENAILHGKNPEDVVWRQWREEDTANVRLRTYDDIIPKTYKPLLSITIVDLYFLEGCHFLKNDEVTQFYIEYSFLERAGPKMETPFSLSKLKAGERITFNFTKNFDIERKKDHKNCKLLSELIKNDGLIKFMIISEPQEDVEKFIQTCQEIGFAEVPVSDLIQMQENEDTYEYEVIDINNPIVVLGYITIKVEGILAMRKMALDYMAPKGYKLYI